MTSILTRRWLPPVAAASAVVAQRWASNSHRKPEEADDASPLSPRRRSGPWYTLHHPTLCDAAAVAPSSHRRHASRLQKRMTSIGHFAVASETATNPSIITFFMELQGDPLQASELTNLWTQADMAQKHPRFHSTISPSNDRMYVPEPVGTRHVTDTILPQDRAQLRTLLQNAQLHRWDLTQSLWHMQVASPVPSMAYSSGSVKTYSDIDDDDDDDDDTTVTTAENSVTHPETANTKSLLIFRGHHALADGASMGAALSDLFDEAATLRDLSYQTIQRYRDAIRTRRKSRTFLYRLWRRWVRFVKLCLSTGLVLSQQLRLTWHALVDADPWRMIERAAAATAPLPGDPTNSATTTAATAGRSISWSQVAPVEQVKWVAKMLSQRNTTDDSGDDDKPSRSITVNDVFVSCVSAALARQLEQHRKHYLSTQHPPSRDKHPPLPHQSHMHVAIPVHLKGGIVLPNESVGNNIGAFVARIPLEGPASTSTISSTDRLDAVSRELTACKGTPAAVLSHLLARGLSHASRIVPWTARVYAASHARSLAVVSNVRGSPVPVHVGGRSVERLYGFVPIPPGVPVGVVVTSYAGRMQCTVTAQPWAVPDGDVFVQWMLEEYLELLAAAQQRQQQRRK